MNTSRIRERSSSHWRRGESPRKHPLQVILDGRVVVRVDRRRAASTSSHGSSPSRSSMKAPRPASVTPKSHTHATTAQTPTRESAPPVTHHSASPFSDHHRDVLSGSKTAIGINQARSPLLSSGSKRGLVTPSGQITTQGTRTASPNYFGLSVERQTDGKDSGAYPKSNWSPPTSSIRSFNTAVPNQLPLDANPEFEAFRKQIDARGGRSSCGLSTSTFTMPPSAPVGRPQTTKRPSQINVMLKPKQQEARAKSPVADAASKMDVEMDNNSLHDSAYVSADSKRASDASLKQVAASIPRFDSPASLDPSSELRGGVSRTEDRHPRLSLAQGKLDPPTPNPQQARQAKRADTLPAALNTTDGPSMISSAQLAALIEGNDDSRNILLLDLRVSPQFAQARIRGALNLCIPTTLLKRATFNLDKLQQTFQDGSSEEKFARWKEHRHLVVYDAHSSELRDATSATNTIKKFTNEGYEGQISILRGGFMAFAATCPNHVDSKPLGQAASGPPKLSLSGASQIAPVIGGVMLPASTSSVKPFFGNIRQNQDLIDGVGQLSVALPQDVGVNNLPPWLRKAAAPKDSGKLISNEFLTIEKTEQARMESAYSSFVPLAKQGEELKPQPDNIQLCGIEKGSKNRYKDILPFEHARVVLQGKTEGSCDYVNASHVQASRTQKRYIASQGPLPATFEDFWSVVWDQDVRVLVMLTAESEGGQLKCHPYWQDTSFGPLKLRALSEKKISLDVDRHHSSSSASLRASQHDGSMTSHGDTRPSQPSTDPFGFGAASTSRRRANTGSETQPPSASATSQAGRAEAPHVIIRKFSLAHAAHPFAPMREITHIHYPSWPDFGAPAQPSHLLALIELANMTHRAAAPPTNSTNTSPPRKASITPPAPSRQNSIGIPPPNTWQDHLEPDTNERPMLVHCSAGCGRTGTFCTVDSVIDMLKRQRQHALSQGEAQTAHTARQVATYARRDGDGDVNMDGMSSSLHALDDAVSPRTTTSHGKQNLSPSPSSSALADHEGLDLEWLEDDSLDLIAVTVEDFRRQRLSMVQSLRQYVLCYETVIEWVWRLQKKEAEATSSVSGNGGSASRQHSRGQSEVIQRK